jgi:hypothetical protein
MAGEDEEAVTCPLCGTEFPVPLPRPKMTLEEAARISLADIERVRRRLFGEAEDGPS